ncbi:MAG: hypothetical protein IJB70_03030 [Clostridia bacterium]|nr:hypothetical protein [Clostridia bacterium]
MIKAEIKDHKGAPSIYVNGEYIPPIMHFVCSDNDIGNRINAETILSDMSVMLSSQKKAADAGVHIILPGLFLDISEGPDAESTNMKALRLLVDNDNECLIIPRLLLPRESSELLGISADNNQQFSDGISDDTPNFISNAYIQKHIYCLKRLINLIKNDKVLSEHVIGYHISGGCTGEYFQLRYWDGVLDSSLVNRQYFKNYLEAKYDTVLNELPDIERLSQYITHGDNNSSDKKVFTDDTMFSDYNEYYSKEIVTMLKTFARVVKEETDGNSLFVCFYGYHFEVYNSYSGHFALHELLHCDDVDILAGPVSYFDRNEGGLGAFMVAANTITAHGKLWIDECDYRMPGASAENGRRETMVPYLKDMDSVEEVTMRQCAKVALHKAGVWWMDLPGWGWWDNTQSWEREQKSAKIFSCIHDNIKYETADVVYLFDERAMDRVCDIRFGHSDNAAVGSIFGLGRDIFEKNRAEAYRSGMSFDLRLIEDFCDGYVDGAQIYVFANPFGIIREGLYHKVCEKLKENQASAIWMFGFSQDEDFSLVKSLTGFDFKVTSEQCKSLNICEATYDAYDAQYLCEAKNGKPLGFYEKGGVGFAKESYNGYTNYFVGLSYLPKELLRYIAKQEDVNIYTDSNDVFVKIGNFAMLHTSEEGDKIIRFPEGATVSEIRTDIQYNKNIIEFCAPFGKTYIFKENI